MVTMYNRGTHRRKMNNSRHRKTFHEDVEYSWAERWGKDIQAVRAEEVTAAAVEVGRSRTVWTWEGKAEGHSFGVISKEPAGDTLPLQCPQHLHMQTLKFFERQFFIHIYRKSQNVKASWEVKTMTEIQLHNKWLLSDPLLKALEGRDGASEEHGEITGYKAKTGN